MTRAGHLTLRQLSAGVGGRGLEGLHELRHPAGLTQLGGQRGHVAGVVGGLGRVGQVEVAQPQAQAAEHLRAGQQEGAPAVAADPQQPAQVGLWFPGERVDLDDPADLLRSRRRGDGGGPARERVPDDDRGPAQMADQREQVAGDVGAGDETPSPCWTRRARAGPRSPPGSRPGPASGPGTGNPAGGRRCRATAPPAGRCRSRRRRSARPEHQRTRSCQPPRLMCSVALCAFLSFLPDGVSWRHACCVIHADGQGARQQPR